MELQLESILLPGIEEKRPLVIAGPCSAETEEQVMDTAKQLSAKGMKIFRAGIWKPRTKPGGFEGIGVEGLSWLKEVKKETGMYVSTEVATAKHVYECLKAGIDILWVGARTTANPFAVQEIADALKGVDIPVLVKNPVNPDLELWIGALERINNAGLKRLGAIHRGFSSYDKKLYRNLPQWHIPIELRRRKGIAVNNKLTLILRIIYSSAVWFLKYLKQINNDVTTAEKELEKSIRNEDLLQLMKLQKTLVYFNTSIRGNEVMIGRLKNIFQDTDYLDLELLEDVVIELKQAYNTVNIYSDILTGTMDAFASIISNNVNAIMKRMTSLSITLMIPTLIASFYGMNVDIHLDGFPHAFVFIILLSAILSAVTFIWFRKIKWF